MNRLEIAGFQLMIEFQWMTKGSKRPGQNSFQEVLDRSSVLKLIILFPWHFQDSLIMFRFLLLDRQKTIFNLNIKFYFSF
jgi:hypothetical protein